MLFAADTIEVYGRIAVKGSEPFTYLAITEPGGKSYKIIGALKETLYKLQGHSIHIEGTLVHKAKGPGIPAELEAAGYSLPGGDGLEMKKRPNSLPSLKDTKKQE